MIAALAAVTEVLKANQMEETETNYFTTLITSLESVDTDESMTAIVCLLAIIVKRMDESVLKSQSKKVTESLVNLLIKYMNSDHCALLRNLLKVMYPLLKVKTHWTETSQELNVVLEFVTHHKPKVRRMAQHIIRMLLIDDKPESSMVHPCGSLVAKFCIEKLESSAGLGKSTPRVTFHVMQMLQEIICAFPTLSMKKCCETIFKIMTLSSSLVTLCGFKALQGLFDSDHKNLPADLNARIITALYDYQPNMKSSDCLICWIQLMERALINLYSLDEKLCIAHLPQFFSAAVKCWLNESEEVMLTVSITLENIVQNCFKTVNGDHMKKAVHKMFHSVEEALGYQYHKSWGHVLSVLAAFFETVGKHYKDIMMKCLHSLGDLHDSYNFPYIPALEKAIGTAIEHMGPRTVLEAIPLQADGTKPDFPRSWMLPLLRDHVKRTELKFFFDYFFDLVVKMKNKALVLEQEKRAVESKLFDVVCSQIWSLLPGFCTESTDLETCLKEVAPILGRMLKNEPSVRLVVLSSIRELIKNEKHREDVAQYSKNYMPILFNLYLTEAKNKAEEDVRNSCFETCKLYLQISDKKLCSTYFKTAMGKLRSSEPDSFMLHGCTDLCKAMVFCVNESEIKELYDYCKPLLQNQNHKTKKKVYGVIKEICSCDSEACKNFVKSQLEDLRLLLSETMSGLTPATRALRLNCLQQLVSQSTINEKSTMLDIVPEAVLCTKENSERARKAAYSLLDEIGQALQRFYPNEPKDALKEYITCLLAGLAGSPHFVSATILAIGRVTYVFKDHLNAEILNNLINLMCELVKSQTREIVVAALSFFKILFAALDTNTLAQHVQSMITGLTNLSEDNQRSLRFKAKELFTRLVRKFGYEMISKMMPKHYQKQLANIRKVESRKQRKKDMKNDDSDVEMYGPTKKTDDFNDLLADSDDDMLLEDEDTKVKAPKSRAKKMKAPCLEENAEEDIVDLLDPSAGKRLLTQQNSTQKQRRKRNDEFKISEDGRLIIEEDEEKPKQKKNKTEDDDVLAELGISLKKNKRKREESDDDEEEQKDSTSVVTKGIHRNIDSKSKRRDPGEEYKAKKAGGDIKRGRYEPYAYVPLNRQALNRRKQVKIKGQFKSFVNAAKRGAAVGMKRKSREARKKKNN
ncbi:RRP12-like protein [Araneus ventricosus]|uniref:RRP12-like protein n=1 Tax=Araneus ventricosus TaxID=182803 RepID=A0A4Y2CPA2_ARAVE|nr:RRP12-like protein [Araneus ventricosus]